MFVKKKLVSGVSDNDHVRPSTPVPRVLLREQSHNELAAGAGKGSSGCLWV